jgi:hypothetical protein
MFLGSQWEQQYTVIASKLMNKKLFNRNCVYMLNHVYDTRGDENCARVATDAWIVWNFHKDTQPIFANDVLRLGVMFPVFLNVYCVSLIKKNTQQFMKCDCLHYKRNGIPCQQILLITTRLRITW